MPSQFDDSESLCSPLQLEVTTPRITSTERLACASEAREIAAAGHVVDHSLAAKPCLQDFELLRVVGQGAFGKVSSHQWADAACGRTEALLKPHVLPLTLPLPFLLVTWRAQVFQVRHRRSQTIYAMKVMKKAHILEREYGNYIKSERDLLTAVSHPYIVMLRFSFQTPTKLYLVLDFLNGGHLFYNLYREGVFG